MLRCNDAALPHVHLGCARRPAWAISRLFSAFFRLLACTGSALPVETKVLP